MLFALAAIGAAAKCAGFNAAVTSAAVDWSARCDAAATVERGPEGSAARPLRAASLGSVPADRRQASRATLAPGSEPRGAAFGGPTSWLAALHARPYCRSSRWSLHRLGAHCRCFLACGSPGAGAILFGSLMALMVGGGVAKPSRRTCRGSRMRQAVPISARPHIAISKVRLRRRTRGTSF